MVVCNSSTLISLSVLCLLDLLEEFFSEIYITNGVWKEVVIDGEGREGAEKVKNAKWIKVVRIEEDELLRLLKKDLDVGEAESIVYAVRNKADLILLDEQEAREIANIYGLKKTGVIGILVRAKLMKKINSLKEVLEELKEKANFRISDNLYQQVLKGVGEI